MRQWLFLFAQWLRRELVVRYRGTWLGALWPFLQPIAQIAVFTMIFHGFMKMRWPSASSPDLNSSADAWVYSLNVLAGLAIFNFFAEILNRSPNVIISQTNLVTKVKFPLAILPIVNVSIAFIIHVLVGLFALLVASIINNNLTFNFLFVFLWSFPIIFYGVSFSLLLSSLGVYLRDISHIMPALTSLLMFLTPIFYPIESVPKNVLFLYEINPISWAVESLRDISLKGIELDYSNYFMHFLISLFVLILGSVVFGKLRNGFSDVL